MNCLHNSWVCNGAQPSSAAALSTPRINGKLAIINQIKSLYKNFHLVFIFVFLAVVIKHYVSGAKISPSSSHGMEPALNKDMDTSIHLAKSLMDAAVERHQVLANNLANVNTPGYARRDLEFKDAIIQALEGGKPADFKSIQREVFEDRSGSFRPDGNNVSTQHELGQISQNELLYRVATQVMSSKLGRLKKAISGGGGQ